MINLKTLVQHQLSEGLSAQELAGDIGVPTFTIRGILKNRSPKSPDVWKKLARHFHKDLDLLRLHTFGLTDSREENANGSKRHKPYRKVPILAWTQIRPAVDRQSPLSFLHSEQRMVETDLSGARVFALNMKDDSMEPLFHEGDLFFVNPDLKPQAGDYVIVCDEQAESESGDLRQLKKFRQQYVLHPLNSRYQDTLLTSNQKIIGRVVRLRMDL